jgi:hypothetical protein
MSIPKQTFFRYIKEFKLKELFNDLGWDNTKLSYPVKVDEQVHTLTGIAEKKGFVIFLCTSDGAQGIPDSAARKKIDNVIAKFHHEHLIIYIDGPPEGAGRAGKKSRQHWELLIREQNKPVVSRPIDHYSGQEPELLFQKLEGLFFTFEDEEKLSIVDVRSRVMANFEKNAEVVTKKFYETFSKEHEKFLGFIKGIQSKVDQEWYASLMLNRLMFIYFIQKKGFLDKNKDYLRTKLKAVQSRKGKDKFYSFYRSFLLVLFHQGLGSPVRGAELEAEIGKVPYLNGGLFDVHKLEHDNKDITIEDKAFERIFDFFDEYNWHLDARVTATGKDINPDVIGYTFEKYINDRSAMGAYYTKEDITEYISKNCIVPWLFDEVKRTYAKPFGKEAEVWTMLKASRDKYIYPAVRHGINPDTTEENGFDDLPEGVHSCIDPNTPDLVEKRKCWNHPAPSDIALPTEIYREVIARRKRYFEIRRKIEAGAITEINDFITYNLNIRQFAQDVLEKTDDAKLIMEFYKAVRKITVLDPTCGSGAFLFAALNVLEPLYFACVTRMREFVEIDGKGKPQGGRHKFFEEQLALIDADEHPSEEYFIYKSIILHNLYGVDIMKEAVEIAKLRLFLKLVATCDVDYSKPNLGLEALPDIDFNIRSGNTLVGYATLADLDKGKQGGLFGDEEKQAILEEADVVSRAYARFKDAQLIMHSNPKTYKDAKDELNKRLTVLNDKLNKYLAVIYLDASYSKKAHDAWLSSHQPFHWLAEYYTTIAYGGFDVIIGNPPYLEVHKVKDQYTTRGYDTLEANNLYALVGERCRVLLASSGRIGIILPNSSVSAHKMSSLQRTLKADATSWISSYAWRPSKLFEGANMLLAIWLIQPTTAVVCFSTRYHRWTSESRTTLFNLIKYADVTSLTTEFRLPKSPGEHSHSVLERILTKAGNRTLFQQIESNRGRYPLYYFRAVLYWVKVLTKPPIFREDGEDVVTGEMKQVTFADSVTRDVVLTILSSNLFSLYYTVWSSCQVINSPDLQFPVDLDRLKTDCGNKLSELGESLIKDIQSNSTVQRREYSARSRDYVMEKQYFFIKLSKPIVDEIDKVLAKHYGFTDEELDFIINYDIKYRMGKELEGEE